jgi:alpha-1,3-rhamnosyl/mannosyltransferase
MPDLYRAADLFVLPSLHEMFGIVLIEAMASGLPVVCHDSPGFRDTCGPSALYQNISVQGELAAGIARLLQDEPRRCLGSQARPWVMHRFSETAIIPLVLEMYRQVIGHDRSRQRKRPAALADRQPS